MAYQYYPNNYYQPYTMQGSSTASGITWVQGENAAKSYPVAAGQSVLLMDSEASSFYIKSTDQSGMPLPLRVFDYKERKAEMRAPDVAATNPASDYVSHAELAELQDEFDKFKTEIKDELKKSVEKPPIRKPVKGE